MVCMNCRMTTLLTAKRSVMYVFTFATNCESEGTEFAHFWRGSATVEVRWLRRLLVKQNSAEAAAYY